MPISQFVNRLNPAPTACTSQAGTTLLEIVIAVACLGITAFALLQATANTRFFSNVVATSEAYREVEGSFRTATLQSLQQAMANVPGSVCNSGPLTISQPLGVNGLGMTLASQIPTLPAGAPAVMLAATQRCNRKAFRQPPGNTDFYFCLLFSGTNNKSFSSSSIAGAALVFAEVRARLFDVVSGATLGCSDYAQMAAGLQNETTSGRGAFDISYALYWYSRGSPTTFKHRNGSFYGALNGG